MESSRWHLLPAAVACGYHRGLDVCVQERKGMQSRDFLQNRMPALSPSFPLDCALPAFLAPFQTGVLSFSWTSESPGDFLQSSVLQANYIWISGVADWGREVGRATSLPF
jgi:hypothetical protein